MKGNFEHLDDMLTAVKFREPPIACGMYKIKDEFDSFHHYHLRRMPRARKYTGRYGLFYHHPDAHWILVGVIDDDGKFFLPVDLPNDYDRFFTRFLVMPRELVERRCCWCGHKIVEEGEVMIHAKEVCSKNLSAA